MASLVSLLVVSLFLLSKTIALNPNITKKNLNCDGKIIYHMGLVISPDITVHLGVFKTGYPKIRISKFFRYQISLSESVSEISDIRLSDTDSDSESDIRKSNFLFKLYFFIIFFIFINGHFG
ncbi:hypothetical protein Hanom_Chr10g00900781 [Helianthus anomalus]